MKKNKGNKKKGYCMIIAVASLAFASGCATARKAVAFGRAGVDAVVSVKDPIFNTADKIIDAAEGVKNATTSGVKETTAAATQ
jgi:hypothetical protein